jgi:redox-sensitive bicupin YhaK (pirin superfamily)
MLALRKSADRGHLNHGWLDTYHTFSFGDYFDPNQMGFRALRVINEDRVAPGEGFGMHGHRDMEIVTLVLSGALAHKDSLGNGEALRPGELQHMSAGSGIRHSEFNPSPSEPVHLYQIWLLPRANGLAPSYSQQAFDPGDRDGRWQLVASPTGERGSLKIQQDAQIHLANLVVGAELRYDMHPGRQAWVQVLRGAIVLNGQPLATSDAAALSEESRHLIRATTEAELMLFVLS